jgi:signal transduction histidine kinase
MAMPSALSTSRPAGLPDPDFKAEIAAIAGMGSVPVLLRIICQVTGSRFAVLARVTGERWVCLASHDDMEFGMRPGDELDIKTTFCQDIWRSRKGIVIDDVAADPRYCDHPTPAMYGFQSYISMPILLRDGQFFGTLCAIDTRPNQLDTPHVRTMFRAFTDLIAAYLDEQHGLDPEDAKQLDARAVSELHDQLVTVLGHDLRNPIAAILAGTKFLGAMPMDERTASIVAVIERSAERMCAMVDDVTDFARARLGDGIGFRRRNERIDQVICHVAEELRVTYPDREIQLDMAVKGTVVADSEQIARLASNLLVNALKYGDPAQPVRISASLGDDFRLAVSNKGPAIPPDKINGLFAPFVRGDVRSDQSGLGLGLYIVSEIARGHGGTIQVRSDDDETAFVFVMPAQGSGPEDLASPRA